MSSDEAPQPRNRDAESTRSVVLPVCVAVTCCLAGLLIGSCISVFVRQAWFPKEDYSLANDTLVALLGSPLAMTFGIFPSLGFYGPWHGLLMLLGMALTLIGFWVLIQSSQLRHTWLLLIGTILWSHNNYLAHAALMSV